jgi:hypothetical protein
MEDLRVLVFVGLGFRGIVGSSQRELRQLFLVSSERRKLGESRTFRL